MNRDLEIACCWAFELFPVFSLFWTVLQELAHTPWCICSCFGGWSWELAGVPCRRTRGQTPISWSLFWNTHAFSELHHQNLRPEALKPRPVVLSPGVHQNHPEPFIKQPTPSSPTPYPARQGSPSGWTCKFEGCQAAWGFWASESPCCSPSLNHYLFFFLPPRIGSQTMRRGR